jgi:hypothetical protein
VDVDIGFQEVEVENLGNNLPVLAGDFAAHFAWKFFILRATLNLRLWSQRLAIFSEKVQLEKLR